MSHSKVHYISISTVRPATQTDSTQQIQLTPWDLSLLLAQYIQKGLLFMKPKLKEVEEEEEEEEEDRDLIHHLKTSFSQALDHFYPFAGRLATTVHEEDNTTSVYIDCNSAGADFIHATAEITLSDFLNPIYVPHIVNSFFPLNGVNNIDGRTHPLISVQVTELIDGLFIGCSVNHSVCDGTSFWHFINSWSEISRNSGEEENHHNQISRPPILKRWFPSESESLIRLPSSCLVNDDKRFELIKRVSAPVEQRVFHFSQQNLASLKSKANNNSQSGFHDSNHKISSLQALLAHFWVAVTRARSLDSNEDTSYGLVIGNRSRLNPPLPEEYFGNSLLLQNTTTKAGELLDKGIGFGGLLLNQMIKSHNEAWIKCCWESCVEKPDQLFFSTPAVFHNSNNLITGSSPRFDMYGNDFGWGKPIAVRSGGANKGDGKLTVFQGAVEGSMDIEASLSLETLKALEDDAEFMEDVTILPPFKSSVKAAS